MTNAATAQAVISPEMIKTFIAEQVGIQFKLMNEKMTALVDEGVDRKVEKKVEEMKAELRTLKADLKAAKNKAKSLRKINVNLTKDNKTMQCKIAQKDKKIETLKNRINTLEAELNKQKHATGSDFKEAKAKFSLVKWLQVKFSKQAPENTEIIYRPTI